MKEEKQQIADIDRSVYDIKDREDDFYKINTGIGRTNFQGKE